MKYISSRGAETGLSFEKVLFSGYARDGGLYFPETIPKIDPKTKPKTGHKAGHKTIPKISN